MINPYVTWLKNSGIPVYERNGIWWQSYQEALIPASVGPCFIEVQESDAKHLLDESGAKLLRYAAGPCPSETEWWYVVSDSYDPSKLSSKLRNQVKRGYKSASAVERLEPGWLAKHGYPCYQSSYVRYRNASPASEEVFRQGILRTQDGPFEYWGVFSGAELVGYTWCSVDSHEVCTNVVKFSPEGLKQYCAYALYDTILTHYVCSQGKRVNNGTRSIAHDTNMQDFLLKFGFKREYGYLHVVYKPWLELLLKTSFPLKGFLSHLPDNRRIHQAKALLFQEELRRKCQAIEIQNKKAFYDIAPELAGGHYDR